MTKTKITDVIKRSSSMGLEKKFHDLKEISCDFKNKIALPLWSRMSNFSSQHIFALPDEMLVQIAENLSDAKTIKSFMETCTRFQDITSHPLLWKRLLKKYVTCSWLNKPEKSEARNKRVGLTVFGNFRAFFFIFPV